VKSGLNPRYNAQREVPTFEELARQVHIDRLPTWKNPKHGQQWLNTLSEYAFPKIGRMPVDAIGQPEVLMCLSPIWTIKHETAKRVAQRLKSVLDVAKSQGYREGENPVTALKDARVLPQVKAKVEHHDAMPWRDVPAFYAALEGRTATAAKALQFTILTACRTSEVLSMTWEEVDMDARLWTIPAERMKGGKPHRVPLTDEMLRILDGMKALGSAYVFEGQKRHRPLSNMSMLMLLRRMGKGDYTVHGFRSSFRDWVADTGAAPREVAETALAHLVGSDVERAYARSDVLTLRSGLMATWNTAVTGASAQ